MRNNVFNKIVLLIGIILSTLTLTSCSGTSDTIMEFTNSTLGEDICKRFESNINIIDSLCGAGFISESSAEKYKDDIYKIREEFLSDRIMITADGINGNTSILKAISQLVVYDWGSLGIDSYTDHIKINNDNTEDKKEDDDTTSDYTITYGSNECNQENVVKGNKYIANFLISNAFVYGPSNIDVTLKFNGVEVNQKIDSIENTRNIIAKHVHPQLKHLVDPDGKKLSDFRELSAGRVVYKANDNIQPLELVSDALAEEISSKLNFEIYVLKPDIFTQDGNSSLDSVVNATEEAFKLNNAGKTKKSSKEINNILSDYFEPLKENGKNVKLLDLAGVDYENFAIIQDSHDVDINNYDTEQKPGYDLVINQRGIDKPVMAIKFHEFNYDAYKRLSETLGLNEGKFYFVTNDNGKGTEGRVYILEYPVYALDELTDTGNKVEGTFKHSGLGINFYTNKIIKYDIESADENNYSFKESGVVTSETVDNYLTIKGADSGSTEGKSSFIVKGKVNMTYNINIAGVTKTINTEVGRIILRDYLEGTYAPGFHSSDYVVAFGRKIRLMFHDWSGENSEKTVWNKITAAAKFIDKEGNDVEDSQLLYITDFCDAQSLLGGDNAQLKILPNTGEVYETVQSTSVQTGDYKTIDNLDISKVSNINPTLLFPSEYIDREDYISDNNAKQRFWVLTTRKGLFNSGLYSGWINSTSDTASMYWWNEYLKSNSMKYTLKHRDLLDYVRGNYKYEAGKYGTMLIIDLDTIKFIQNEMDEDAEIERNQLIRTVFILLGWFLICYSILLILAWIIDTNSDIGIGLLNKLTMGSWLAVKYSTDVPANDISGVKCIDSSRLMFSVIILIAVGIILINVNVFELIIAIIEVVGSLARTLEKLLQGTR